MASASIISIAAGRMPAPMIADTAAPPCPVVPNAASRVGTASREPGQLHDDLGDDAERALRADERAEQVVPGRRAGAVAEPGQLAGRGHDLQAGDVVHGEAVLEAVRAAGVLRHVAADRADHLAGRVRGVEQAVRRRRLAHGQIGHARLDDRPAAGRVDRDDPPHLRHDDQHAVSARQRPAGQPGARAAGHERHARPGARGDDRGDLLGRPPAAPPAPGLARCEVSPSHS